MDIVVTVPHSLWNVWCGEGDLPGDPPTGCEHQFTVHVRPRILPGERVYIVADSKIRGYAPLVRMEAGIGGRCHLIRAGDAVAVTIDERIRGFQGIRYRWWRYEKERPFPDWRIL